MLSTGSPLSDESFAYVYREIKADLCLASISGGTDIISCFVLGNSNLPVRRGELQCRGLGMAVDIFDAQGKSLVGEKGSLSAHVLFLPCRLDSGEMKREVATTTHISIAIAMSGVMVILRSSPKKGE